MVEQAAMHTRLEGRGIVGIVVKRREKESKLQHQQQMRRLEERKTEIVKIVKASACNFPISRNPREILL